MANNDGLGRVPKEVDGKRRMDLIPWPALNVVGDVMTFGFRKYSARGYVGMDLSGLYAANVRHLSAWQCGEDNDPETGFSHLAHAAANSLMMLELLLTGQGVDDRPQYDLQTVADPPSTT